MTIIDIYNRALDFLGTQSVKTIADSTNEARLCNRNYDNCRRSVLRSHPWNFAITRAALIRDPSFTPAFDFQYSYTLPADFLRLTKMSADVPNPIPPGIITVVNARTDMGQAAVIMGPGVDLSTIDQSYLLDYGGSAVVRPDYWISQQLSIPRIIPGGTTFRGTITILSTIDYVFTNQIISTSMSGGSIDDWRIERGHLITDNQAVQIAYVADVTDPTQWDPMCADAIALYLAWIICYKITQSNALKDQIFSDFQRVLSKARFIDSTEDPKQDLDIDVWMRSRVGPSQGFVRDPMT